MWNVRGGGIEAVQAVHDGEAQLSIATPAKMMQAALTGSGMFASHAMPDLRALGVLPQNDRMMLAVDPKYGVKTFDDIRRKKPALRIAISANDGTNFIGYTAARLIEAHGISKETLRSWGGSYVTSTRPEQSLFLARDGKVDAVLQEAIMTPWWIDVMEIRGMVPIPAEAEALATLGGQPGFSSSKIRAGFWETLETELLALDFSDFVILVCDDLPDDVAYLLTCCLVERRENIERQYYHIPPERSPLSYPLVPSKTANTPLPLHPGARKYYQEAVHLKMEPLTSEQQD